MKTDDPSIASPPSRRRMAVLTIVFSYAAAGVSYATQFWLARKLGDERFGVFSLSILWANVMQTILQFGTDRTLIRDLVQSETPCRVFSDSNRLRIMLTLVGIPCFCVFVLFSGESHTAQLAMVAGLGFGVASALSPMAWYDFRRTMHLQSAIIFLEKVIFGAGVVLLAVWLQDRFSALFAIGMMSIAAMIGLAIQWLPIRRDCSRVEAPATHGVSRMFQGNVAVVMAALGNMGMTHANQLVLNQFVGKAGLAHYSISFQLIRIVQLFLGQYIRICAPDIAKVTSGRENEMRKGLKVFFKQVAIALLVSFSIVVPVYVAGRWIILGYLSESYAPAVRILGVLSLWCLIFGPASVVNRFLLSLHLQRWFFFSAVVFGVVSVAIGFALIPSYQGVGAAFALLIGHGLSALFQAVLVVRALSQNTKAHLTTNSNV
ncbi:MAG: oligosaccharide flippase family protein [Pirellulaceae bacterium]